MMIYPSILSMFIDFILWKLITTIANALLIYIAFTQFLTTLHHLFLSYTPNRIFCWSNTMKMYVYENEKWRNFSFSYNNNFIGTYLHLSLMTFQFFVQDIVLLRFIECISILCFINFQMNLIILKTFSTFDSCKMILYILKTKFFNKWKE